MKYIIITGGVISGVGKGVIASTLALLLKNKGLNITVIKIDPYLNYDAGRLSPTDHGEVYVLDDGGETDMDLGNYERFLGENFTSKHNITGGKVYMGVMERERRGYYLGQTIQTVPHITNYTIEMIEDISHDKDVTIIEVGGIVGDMESTAFLDALKCLKLKNEDDMCVIHVSPVFALRTVGELKTKPTQTSVRTLAASGLKPYILLIRTPVEVDENSKTKLSIFCNLSLDNIIPVLDAETLYHVPLMLEDSGIMKIIAKKLRLSYITDLGYVKRLSELLDARCGLESVKIAVVGKYTNLKDSYASVIKALEHASFHQQVKLEIVLIESSTLESEDSEQAKLLDDISGMVIPGGFGSRGIEGLIIAANKARTNRIPFLGICLGFQIVAIDIIREVIGSQDATSTEFDPNTSNPVAIPISEEEEPEGLIRGMKLGGHENYFEEGSLINEIYQKTSVRERHRHRYIVNPKYLEKIESHNSNVKFMGWDKDKTQATSMEISKMEHPYFIAVQYHPEFTSRIWDPSPLFTGLIRAARKIPNED